MQTTTAHGVIIPKLGLGTWQITGGDAETLVAQAIDRGYRHVDTARAYGNETEVGRGIRAASVPREEIFLTTKIWPTDFAADALMKAAADSVKNLGVGAVDLLLLHWPTPEMNLAETIPALNRARSEGLARNIGVSNFTKKLMTEAFALSEAPLIANQVEYHPFLEQTIVLETARALGMAITAYCPLARGKVLGDPTLKRIGAAHGASETQVALAWLLAQDDVIAIPRSSKIERVMENWKAQDIRLSDAEIAEIHAMARPDGRLVKLDGLAPDWD